MRGSHEDGPHCCSANLEMRKSNQKPQLRIKSEKDRAALKEGRMARSNLPAQRETAGPESRASLPLSPQLLSSASQLCSYCREFLSLTSW